MKKTFIYIVFSVLILGSLCAQNANSDAPKDIDPEVYAYYKQCDKNKNLPQVLTMADTLYRMAEEKGDKRTMCAALCYKPQYYLNTNVIDSAEKYVSYCKQKSRQLGYPKYYYFIWNRQIQIYLANHHNAAAMKELEKMQKEATRENSQEGLIECYRALAGIYNQQHLFDLSLEYNTKLINYVESNGIEDKNHLGTYIRQIELLLNTGREKEAQEYVDKAQSLVVRESQKVTLLCAEICYYTDIKKFKTAEAKVNELLKMVSVDQMRTDVISALAHHYYHTEQYAKAAEILDLYREKMGTLGMYQRIYLGTILHLPGRIDEAIELNREILDNYDSLRAAEQAASLAEISALVDNERLQEENAQMSEERSSLMMKVYIGATIFLVLFFVSLLFFLLNLMDKRNKLNNLSTSKQAMENEIATAGQIQAHMIPAVFPAFPERDDFSLFAKMRPAKMIGGDLYDYYLLGDKLYFIVGDVSGKGVPASLFMSLVCSTFRTYSQMDTDVRQIVRNINHAMGKNNESNMFVTLMAGVLDTRNGMVTLCNAGHNLPMLVHGGDVTTVEMESGLPLGLFNHEDFPVLTLKMDCGDKLVVYTDGVTEAENNENEMFGFERLQKTLAQNVYLDATLLTKVVSDRVDSFVDGAAQSDDITILTIQFHHSYRLGN